MTPPQPELEPIIQGLQKANLQREGMNLAPEEIADILWLAVQMYATDSETTTPSTPQQQTASSSPPSQTIIEEDSLDPPPPPPDRTETQVMGSLQTDSSASSSASPSPKGLPFKTPAVPALRHRLALSRALRPLRRKVPSRTETVLDQAATVYRIAEERLWYPVLKPALTRWLDVEIVVEDSNSLGIWQQTIEEFHQLLLRQGAFRDVRVWQVRPQDDGTLVLYSPTGSRHHPKELIDPKGERLLLVVSDCVSPAWYRGQWHNQLEQWGKKNLVTLLQLLPPQFWRRTALSESTKVWLSSRYAGATNHQWQQSSTSPWEDETEADSQGFPLPVISLEPHALRTWAKAVVGMSSAQLAGYCLTTSQKSSERENGERGESHPSQNGHFPPNFEQFLATTSPTAKRLAALMAVVPVQMPIVRLIQQTLLPQSDTTHIAEVFLSGILERKTDHPDPEKRLYDFTGDIRQQFFQTLPKSEKLGVIEHISEYIAHKVGKSLQEFRAILKTPSLLGDEELTGEVEEFARVAVEVLQQMGGEYAAFAEEIVTSRNGDGGSGNGTHGGSPEPQPGTLTFEVAEIEVDETMTFEFDVARLERQDRTGKWVIRKQRQHATGIIEDLAGRITLELVEIPGGRFLMGSPKDEDDSQDRERPQHEVMVQPFYMGRFPITQGQWKVVVESVEPIERELEPDPSRFKDSYENYNCWSRPVEKVSWFDAVEFCARLSRLTGQQYRLPTEAEWEYACRAMPTPPHPLPSVGEGYPPFHFGETLTTDLANYRGTSTYGGGLKGEYRGQTTPVGYFQVANAFGLYDMHGNVWEWCEDDYGDYKNAPTDGSAARFPKRNATRSPDKSSTKARRGGSWYNAPSYCRSAYRYDDNPDLSDSLIGLRVVRLLPRTL